ncbi:MAG TPA: hypothetical protein VFD38_00140, partial [Myxococcaceae bacterium]|nr:hypothetical protein [Myxococcaceae bacterium]
GTPAGVGRDASDLDVVEAPAVQVGSLVEVRLGVLRVGGVFGPSLLGSLAGTFLGTAIASHFLHGFGGATPEGLTANEPDGAADPEHSEADLDQGSDLDGGGFDDIEV